MHRWGIQLFQYLDDWLIQASSANDCLRQTEIVLRLCQDLGLVVNKEKSALLDQGTTALKWQVLLGLLTSSEKAVPLGRLHTREIHYALWCQWDFNPSTNHRFVGLLPPARDNLLWRTLERNVFRGSPIVPLEPEVRILTDASEQGWGAHMDWQTASGMWSAEEAQRHINFLELHSSLATGAARSGSSSRIGQFDCSGLLETPRWRTVDFANQIGDVDFSSVSPLSDSAGRQTYSGGTECLGRLIVEKGTGSARRMVAESSRVPSCYSTVGNSHGRSVRDQAQCPPSVFRFAISRPCSDGSRCPVSELATHVGLCVPTTRSSSVGAAEDPSRHVPDNFNRPALARGSLVCVTT